MVFAMPQCPYPEHHPKCDDLYQVKQGEHVVVFRCEQLRGHEGNHSMLSSGYGLSVNWVAGCHTAVYLEKP